MAKRTTVDEAQARLAAASDKVQELRSRVRDLGAAKVEGGFAAMKAQLALPGTNAELAGAQMEYEAATTEVAAACIAEANAALPALYERQAKHLERIAKGLRELMPEIAALLGVAAEVATLRDTRPGLATQLPFGLMPMVLERTVSAVEARAKDAILTASEIRAH